MPGAAEKILAEYQDVVRRALVAPIAWGPEEAVPNAPPAMITTAMVGTWGPNARVTTIKIVAGDGVTFRGVLFAGNTLCRLLPEDAESFWALAQKAN